MISGVACVAVAESTTSPLTTVEVIGTTPLPGLEVPVDQVPSNVQSVSGEDLRRRKLASIADLMVQSLTSVTVNEAQSNPFQPDVSFRGFTGSPLLGNPIGLSVFVDGVRVNESFGDTVFWDLIPTPAVASISLIPGSNPVFGLNTLGGALTVRTRSGRTDPGLAAAVSGGSFGRRSAQLNAGGANGSIDAFGAVQYYEEDGWRDRSPSTVRQAFGKVGWENAATRIELAYTQVDNQLIGNGLAAESILSEDRDSVYTYPDETQPELNFANLMIRHDLGDGLMLSGNLYRRKVEVRTFNGDAEFDDDEGEYEAENRRTVTHQTSIGATVQLTYTGNLGGRGHQLAVGASRDRGRAEFSQLEQEADFTDDRGTIGEGDFEEDTAAFGRNVYEGIYATDTIEFAESLHLTVSGRYNKARLRIRDRSGETPELDGDHAFSRFNPAAGLTYQVSPAATFYGGYSEGFRTPTPVELTCADPDAPCSLPVSFVADPPLDAVIARSWEGGVRGDLTPTIHWNATAYSTRLANDIVFTSVGGSRGFFANVPGTRRQGVELSVAGRQSVVRWSANYAYVDATFRADTSLFNPVANEDDPAQPETVEVESGDRLPGIPQHVVKLDAEVQASPSLSFGVNLITAASQYFRGDESNDQEPLGGYTVLGVRAAYQVAEGLQFFAKVDNLLDKDYSTLGAFNRNAFGGEEGLGPVERFVSPAAPRNFWVGVEYAMGSR